MCYTKTREGEEGVSTILGLVNVEPESQWTDRLRLAATGTRISTHQARVWLGGATDEARAPVEDEKGSVAVVYDGFVSDHETLRARLAGQGMRFTSDDPGETILRAYQAWGESAPEHIEGPCAYVIWDAEAQRLLAVGDRIGTRRLHFAQQGEGLIVASHLRTLLSLRDHAAEPDPQSLAYVLAFGYVPGAASMFRGVGKLQPAECLIWNRTDGVRRRRYWEPPRTLDDSEDRASWRDIFEQALERSCPPGEPVGLMLSGGLDSSSIALGLSRLGRPVKALTLNTPGFPDESGLAVALAEHLKIPCTRGETVAPEAVVAQVDEVVPALDEPPCNHAILTSYAMCRTAAAHFGVLLTGDGAEETMGGREWYGGAVEKPARGEADRSTPSLLRRLRRSVSRKLRSRAAPPVASGNAAGENWHVAHVRSLRFSPEEITALLAPAQVSFTEADVLAPLVASDEPSLPERRRMQRLDIMNYCPNVVLPKLQQPASALGLDVRVPFLDHRLVEWAISKPVEKREFTERKPVLRDYLRGHVPDAIVNLPKHGLNPQWSRLLSEEETLGQLRDGYWIRSGYWTRDIANFVRPGEAHWRGKLFTLYLLERWAAHWLH